MIKKLKSAFIIFFINAIVALPAIAARAQANTSHSVKSVIITTVMLGSVVAIILVNFSKRSSKTRINVDSFTKLNKDNVVLENAINEVMDCLPGSRQDKKRASMTLSNIFDKKMEEKIISTKDDMAEKYGKIIDDKTESEKIIREKYRETIIEKKQTEGVIKSIAEGLVVIDNKGEVLLMNPAAEKLLDVDKKNKIGRPLLENAKEEQLFSLVKGKNKKTESDNIEIELSSKDESTRKIIKSSSAVIEDENGKTIGMVSVLSDVTKQKELDEIKANFVSSVSHELRNPIAATLQSIALILSKATGPLTKDQEKFLANAKRSLNRLNLLVDDLLDLAKLEAKKMEMVLEPCSIEGIIDETIDTFSQWAKNKNIELIKDIAPEIPKVHVDTNRIIQVLTNLIGNALKFIPQNGKITISAKMSTLNKEVEVSITDDGIGIAQDDLRKIFDKFHQVKTEKTAKVGGTGLGLSIAKEIVDMHKGEIWVESEKGQGAKFTFTLPVA